MAWSFGLSATEHVVSKLRVCGVIRLEQAMIDPKEGILQKQASGRWAVCRPGSAPIEITSGELFRVEVDGKLEVTRMEFAHAPGGGELLFGRRVSSRE
jgi:hypothetical protein